MCQLVIERTYKNQNDSSIVTNDHKQMYIYIYIIIITKYKSLLTFSVCRRGSVVKGCHHYRACITESILNLRKCRHASCAFSFFELPTKRNVENVDERAPRARFRATLLAHAAIGNNAATRVARTALKQSEMKTPNYE